MEGRKAILVSSPLHCWLQHVQTRKLYPPIPFLQFVAGAPHHKCFKQCACKPCCSEAQERASSLRHWQLLNDPHGNTCTSNHTFYHVWTTVIESGIAVPNRTQITCKHCLTAPVALPCSAPVFPLLLACGMILACLHSLHAESFTLLNSCSNATIPLLLPIYLLFSTDHLTGTLPATVP